MMTPPGNKKAIEKIPTVNQLQERLDNTTALLSFHLTTTELLTIFITPSRFEYYRTAINTNFFSTIESFKTALHSTTADQRYTGAAVSTKLYEKLISPLRPQLTQIKRLVIIPDDELNYLPFEALQDENKNILLNIFPFNTSIQQPYWVRLKSPTLLPGICHLLLLHQEGTVILPVSLSVVCRLLTAK